MRLWIICLCSDGDCGPVNANRTLCSNTVAVYGPIATEDSLQWQRSLVKQSPRLQSRTIVPFMRPWPQEVQFRFYRRRILRLFHQQSSSQSMAPSHYSPPPAAEEDIKSERRSADCYAGFIRSLPPSSSGQGTRTRRISASEWTVTEAVNVSGRLRKT